MIPKIIHFSWLSGDPFPEDIAKCLISWKTVLKDYELWLWGKKPADCLGLDIIEKPFDLNSVTWCKQAYETKKYAFAADYIRLWAIYNYGGIYMDSDVIMYKSFNDLLSLPYFIGEDSVHCFEPAIFGAEKNCKWIHDVLRRYDRLNFIGEDGVLNMLALPKVFQKMLSPKYKFRMIKSINSFVYEEGTLNIFPNNWFNSRNYIKSIQADGAYCSHRFVGSWLKPQTGFRWQSYVPDVLLNIMYGFLIEVVYRKSLKADQIQYIK